eukprot:scaffold1383_cov68-Cylindrotheca_fusiformis.AAC.2
MPLLCKGHHCCHTAKILMLLGLYKYFPSAMTSLKRKDHCETSSRYIGNVPSSTRRYDGCLDTYYYMDSE